jgi:hypothetical protein
MLTFCLGALAAALLLAALSPLASTAADGLARVLKDHSVAESPAVVHSPMGDYQVPGVSNANLSKILAGLTGTLVAFALAVGLGRLIRARRAKKPAAEGAPGATNHTPASRPGL